MLERIESLLLEANNRFDVTNAKIDAYVEHVLGQYEINCKKAELKVLTESGDFEDLMYFENEAVSSAIDSIKKAIDKIIETFVNIVNEIKLKILSTIAKKETKTAINEMEKKIKFNPFLSNKKVQVEDTKKQLNCVAWANSELQKLISKIKSGKKVEADEVDTIGTEFKKRMDAAKGIPAAIKTKLGNAASMLKKAGDGMADSIEKFSKITKELINDAKSAAGELHMEAANTLKSIASKASEIGRAAVNAIVEFWRSTLAVIRNAVSKAKPEAKNESAISDAILDSMGEEMMLESNGDSVLADIENELFGENDFVNESTSDEDEYDSFMEMFELDVLGE